MIAAYAPAPKPMLYARFAVREYWVIDVNSRSIDSYSDAVDGQFRSTVEYRLQDTIRPLAFPEVTAVVKELFVVSGER